MVLRFQPQLNTQQYLIELMVILSGVMPSIKKWKTLKLLLISYMIKDKHHHQVILKPVAI